MNLPKPKRNRGFILTPIGAKKIRDRVDELEQQLGVKYNFNKIAEQAQLIDPQGLHPKTIRKILGGQGGGDESSLRLIFRVLELELEELDYTQPGRQELVTVRTYQDWGEAIDVSIFYGRRSQLKSLEQWAIADRCRLIAVLGMGGIGKTALSVKLAEQLQDEFEFLMWRSLRHATPAEDLLTQLLQFLSQQQDTEATLPKTLNGRISRLMDYLRAHRCLLVLDNVETILNPDSPAGRYREGYEGYGEIFRRIAETVHQSCLIFTSREKPKDMIFLEGDFFPVRSLQLDGLPALEGEKIFQAKGLRSSACQYRQLTQLYQGNPLALKIVATSIQELFQGKIADFLAQGVTIFNGIRQLLDQQFARLSVLEKRILYWLAINRQPVSLETLRGDLIPSVQPAKLLETLESIGQRSLLEKVPSTQTQPPQFTLQSVVMEYITEQFIEQICQEIRRASRANGERDVIELFKYHSLLKAESPDPVRETQARLILQPIVEELLIRFGNKDALRAALMNILEELRSGALCTPGYMAGNVLNLLCQLDTDLSGYDFSHLTIWQADLRGVNLRRVNFTGTDLAKSAFSESFGNVYAVAFSPDGTLLATGHEDGECRLWQVADGKLLFSLYGHSSTVWSVAFSPDGQTLASGSFDCTIRLWDVTIGQVNQVLHGHEDWVWVVAFSPDGEMLASGSSDRTVKLWHTDTGQCIRTLQGHTDLIDTIAFNPHSPLTEQGVLFASGSADQTVRFWDIHTGECCQILRGHTHQVSSIAFSPDGQTLASSEGQVIKLWNVKQGKCKQTLQKNLTLVWSLTFSPDGKTLAGGDAKVIRFWDVQTGECYQSLSGYTSQVWSVAFSPDGRTIAGSDRHMVGLWQISPEVRSQELGVRSQGSGFRSQEPFSHSSIFPSPHRLQTLQTYNNPVWCVAYSPDGQILASGSADQTVNFWDMPTRSLRRTLHHHRKSVRAIAFSPDGQLLASGSDDNTVRLWERSTLKSRPPLIGHQGCVWSVAFSPDGHLLASSGADRTIQLWDVCKNCNLTCLSGHSSWVLSIAFSPHDGTLASASEDQTVKLWNVRTGECYQTLQGHKGFVSCVAFSPTPANPQLGVTLASSGEDGIVKLWDIQTGECCRTLQGHESFVWCLAFSPNGQHLASGSIDRKIRLWDIATGTCLKILEGHTSSVWSLVFSPDGQTLISGSNDESIKYWHLETGECFDTKRPEKIYEGMNITRVTGVTEAQKATLKALGATEDDSTII